MKIKRAIAVLMAAAMLAGLLSGCQNEGEGSSSSSSSSSSSAPPPASDLKICHNNKTYKTAFEAICKAYEQDTGKKVHVEFAEGGYTDSVRSMNPGIFVVAPEEFEEWDKGGYMAELSAAEDSGLSALALQVPEGLRLSKEGTGNYGIPCGVVGRGYIFDPQMLEDLFPTADVAVMVEDLVNCSYAEFEQFVTAVSSYIATPSAATVALGGRSYVFAAEKTGLAKNLTGVFAASGGYSEPAGWLLDQALGTAYESPYAVTRADDIAVADKSELFGAYIKALDLETGNLAGAEGKLLRGEKFTDEGNYGREGSLALLSGGKALFLLGESSMAGELGDADISGRLLMMPAKIPITAAMITATDLTEKKLLRSISVAVEEYFVLNPKADTGERSEAEKFLTWLYSEEGGANFIVNSLNMLPFNYSVNPEEGGEGEGSAPASRKNARSSTSGSQSADPSTSGSQSADPSTSGSQSADPSASAPEDENPIGGEGVRPNGKLDSLSASVAAYLSAGDFLPAVSRGLPAGWLEDAFSTSINKYYSMESWTEENLTAFGNELINGWKNAMQK